MSKFLVYSLIVIGLSATAAVSARPRDGAHNRRADASLAADGAFRDGLFLGKLSAATGRAMQPPVGRWSLPQDRENFSAGYRSGYQGGR